MSLSLDGTDRAESFPERTELLRLRSPAVKTAGLWHHIPL